VYEIEQKYRIRSPEKIRQLLIKKGARKIREGREINYLYDCGTKLLSQSSVLRLRHWGGPEGMLTFKGPRMKARFKKRMELETAVHWKVTEKILLSLGYSRVAEYRKQREEYQLGSAHVALDFLKGKGWFAEIEASETQIEKLEKALGLNPSDREPRNYLEIAGLPARIIRSTD